MADNNITFSIQKGTAELWMEYVHGYGKTSTEIEQALATTQEETIYCSGLINKPFFIINFIDKITPGYFNFEEWYRLKITDKRILMSEYGGFSSWRILNMPVSQINSISFSGRECKIILSPDGNLYKTFEASRKAIPNIKDTISKVCPRIKVF
jgi:hypothetical protein